MKAFIKGITKKLDANSPTVLTGVACGGVIATAFLASKATLKVDYLIDEERSRRYAEDYTDKMKMFEILKIALPHYLPAITIGVTTIACIISANSINLKRNAALAGLYGVTKSAFDEFKAKTEETIGKTKTEKIKDDILQDKVAKKFKDDGPDVVIVGEGDVACMDAFTSQVFSSSHHKIMTAQNVLNKKLLDEGFVSMNDFFYEIGATQSKYGDDLGWHIERGDISFRFTSTLDQNHKPVLVIDYEVEPMYASWRDK